MTTITIEKSKINIPAKFETERELLEFLINQFNDKTYLVNMDYDDLSQEEQKAHDKHSQNPNYDDFIDFQG